MIAVVVVLFGLVVGSFLNAVIYRLGVGASPVHGRSKCPKCGHVLTWYDLIPVVSFFAVRGKCRYCNAAISWQYPAVEAVTAASFLLLYLRFSPRGMTIELFTVTMIFFAVCTSFLIIIFVYDLLHYLILDSVVVPAALIAFVGNLILGVSWWHLALGAGVAGGFFALQYVVSRGQWIGDGDIRLGVFMGALLSWPAVVVALALAYGAGCIVGLAMIAGKKKTMKSEVPFGTFLSAATFVTMLYGDAIIRWYLSWL